MAIRRDRTTALQLDSAKIEAALTGAMEESRKLGESMERGQAETPLSDRLEEMDEVWSTSGLSALLVGVSASAASKVLALFTGENLSALESLQFPDSVCLIEFFFPSDVLALHDEEGTWKELHSFEDLRDSVAGMTGEESLGDSPTIHYIQVRMKSSRKLATLKLCVPNDFEGVLESPSLLLRASSATSLLIVAAPLDAQIPPLHKELLSHVSLATDAFMPVVVAEKMEALPPNGWWNDGQVEYSGVSLPPLLLYDDARAEVPAMLSDPSDALRKGLLLSFVRRNLQSVCEALVERQKKETRQASRKRGLLESKAKELDELTKRTDSRMISDAVKYELDSTTARLSANLANLNQMEFAPTSEAWVKLARLINTLEELDMGESTPKAVRLEIPEAFTSRLRRFMENLTRNRLEHDFVLIRQEVTSLRNSLSQKLSDFAGKPISVELEPPDEEEVWNIVRSLVTIEFRSRGELPKRSFFQFLSTGRQMAFMVLISAQLLLGSVLRHFGLNLRNIAPIVIAIFALGVFAGVRGWKKDKEEMLRKELDRVKEGLQDEAKRLAQETQRDKMGRINIYLNALGKQTLHKTDGLIKRIMDEKILVVEKEKSDIKSSLSNLDLRIRQLEANDKSLATMEKSLVELESLSNAVLARELESLQKSLVHERERVPERPSRTSRPSSPPSPKRERPTLSERPPISIDTKFPRRKDND